MIPSDAILCISGPTASGKTALAEKLAVQLDAEIINADMGQFYRALSIGTAKPDYKATPFKQHLFDVCDEPVDYDVMRYRTLVLETIKEIQGRNKRVIIVGGSLFYLKSLFFPPHEGIEEKKMIPDEILTMLKQEPTEVLWQKLFEIDYNRASVIHQNDRYRIERALELFYMFGKKPSSYKPTFKAPFDPFFIWVEVDTYQLAQRIAQRTDLMLKAGWIEEVEKNNSDAWYSFYERKGLIGYQSIVDWITKGKKESEYEALKADLIRSTCLYAKRQRTFWGSFLKQLQEEPIMQEKKEPFWISFDTTDAAMRNLLSLLKDEKKYY